MADDTIKVKLLIDDKKLDEVPKKAKGVGSRIGTEISKGINSSIGKLGGILAGALAFRKIATQALEYEKALAEVRTISQGLGIDNQKLQKDLLLVSGQFGTTAAAQAKAFYQIISAGVTDAAKAQSLLISANKLAIGGLTSTEGAIDLLTSAVNSFQKSNLSGERAADILFGTVRLGKTTIEELQGSLGQILPTASALGISFEDTNAALAQLTTRGVSTSEAVTQLNAVFTAVLKKQETAKTLGPEVAKAFSLQALQTKGLTGFLRDLNGALGGSETKLVKLLGRAEGARAIITLAADSFEGLDDKVKQLTNSQGSADAAFQELNKTIGQKLNVTSATFFSIIQSITSETDGPLSNALDSVNSILTNVANAFSRVNNSGEVLGLIAGNIQLNFLGAKLAIQEFLVEAAKVPGLQGLGVVAGDVNATKTAIEETNQAILEGFKLTDALPKDPVTGRTKNPLGDLNRDAEEAKEKIPTALESVKEGFKDVFGFLNEGGQVSNDRLTQLAKNTSNQLKSIGQKFAKGFAGSFAQVGAALVKGEDAFAAFGKAILGVFGKIAIETGTVIFLQGLGTFNPSQIGTGLALITLGGALQAIGGGGVGGGAPSVAGGPLPVEPTGFGPTDTFEDEELQEPQTVVNVSIDGVVSDPAGVASQIANLLSDFNDSNGGVVVQEA